MEQTPVRRHVEISARSAVQLELRLHGLARALSVRRGYIVCSLRRLDGSGRHVASVAYELPLPSFARPHGDRRHAEKRYGARESNDARQVQDSSSSLM